MSKMYFSDYDYSAHTLDYWKDLLNEMYPKGSKIELTEAKRIIGSDYFYCKEFQEVGEKGYCGKVCEKYEPRNGKNGICKHSRNPYEKTKTKITIQL